MLGICSSNNNNHSLQSLHHVKGDLHMYMFIASGNPVSLSLSLSLSYFCFVIALYSLPKLPSSLYHSYLSQLARARYLERNTHTTHLALSSQPTAISAHHHNLTSRWSLQIEGPPSHTIQGQQVPMATAKANHN